MKTSDEVMCIEWMIESFNNASDYAGYHHTMVYMDDAEEICIDCNDELCIDLKADDLKSCFRDIVRGLYWLITDDKAYKL